MSTQPYTRGSQVLSPTDVEYLFRAIRTDTTTIRNRVMSLVRHFGQDVGMSTELESAVEHLTDMAKHLGTAEKLALPKVFPHRSHAGEHEDW